MEAADLAGTSVWVFRIQTLHQLPLYPYYLANELIVDMLHKFHRAALRRHDNLPPAHHRKTLGLSKVRRKPPGHPIIPPPRNLTQI